jgi:glucoamylase
MKFCIPIGFVLWLSIYLMYRNQFSTWSERVPGRVISSDPFPGDRAHDDGKQGLDEWIKRAGKVAWREIVNNVGPAVGAKDGAVVASPSAGEWEDEPDYYVS